jgi:predicted DNA repair protein MutK
VVLLLSLLSMNVVYGLDDMAIADEVCPWLIMVRDTIVAVAPSLVFLMFTYGGVKYIFSADDPGGRKQGKNTCIHAVIGGILIILADTVITGIATFQQC